MKTIDNTGVTFVNLVLGRGILNGVVNIQLGTWLFTGNADGNVEPDAVVSCRLRMDLACAKVLRDNLNELLAAVEAPAPTVAVAEEGKAVANGAAKH